MTKPAPITIGPPIGSPHQEELAVVADFGPRLIAVIDRVIHQELSTAEVDVLIGLLGRIERAAGGSEVAST